MSSAITYLDYAATTPVDTAVAAAMMGCLTLDGNFANPASRSHRLGWQAEAAVEKARKQVAHLLHADTREIVWTSGATESNNLAIKGVVQALSARGRHIITSTIEHKSVIDSCAWLETQGVEVTWLQPEPGGFIAPEALAQAIRPDTILASLMHVNNETGVINDIAAFARIARQHNVVLHVDAAQSAGKLELDLQALNIDLLSICAHKIYGPKGIGALFVRRRAEWQLPPMIHGGGHERGMRSGTLPTHQIASMGLAFELASSLRAAEQEKIAALSQRFLAQVMQHPAVALNGAPEQKLSGILNLCFRGVDAQVLMSALPSLAISSGSACASASLSPSYVLKGMGLSDTDALSSLRFSFGRFTTEQDVDGAASAVLSALQKLV